MLSFAFKFSIQFFFVLSFGFNWTVVKLINACYDGESVGYGNNMHERKTRNEHDEFRSEFLFLSRKKKIF